MSESGSESGPESGPESAIVIEKDMGITHAEFMRLLPRALGDDAYTVSGTKINYQDAAGRKLAIELGPESERRIALMHIPRTPVSLHFHGYDETALESFMTHFNRSYQRGGG